MSEFEDDRRKSTLDEVKAAMPKRTTLTKEDLAQRPITNAALRLVRRPRGVVFYCHTHGVAVDTHDLIDIEELTWAHRGFINARDNYMDHVGDDFGHDLCDDGFVDCEIWYYDPQTRFSTMFTDKPTYWYPTGQSRSYTDQQLGSSL